ncbi:DGC domain protein [Novipirellula aureliae]|uniref:DGC domain protein n=1 Tax=Novipirellula aureliae TaxID=2527966 RepID=A0A5C6DRV8_9BACT|nr:putative zinc-binding protein [Novipirellula aureliae]TWU37756.1 DGC domain protein [Novipirellula aureliae]
MDNTENQKNSCACSEAPKLIFACSGAADVGHVSDLAARKLSAEGVGKMFCLAGIGGRVSGIVETTRAASSILAIDGCPLDCARNSLEQAGFTDVQHIRLSDMQMEKGKTPPNQENVDKVVQQGRACLIA